MHTWGRRFLDARQRGLHLVDHIQCRRVTVLDEGEQHRPFAFGMHRSARPGAAEPHIRVTLLDFKGHSVVISGDTRYSENVVKHGTGADLLIHEVGAVRPELAQDPQVRRVMAHHTSPRDVGRVFSQAKPKLAIYTHLALLARPDIPPLTSEDLIAQTRETYDGPLEVGEDLMSFDVAEDGKVAVLRPARN
jgi:ribonuclease BN (tRNA processing enzyme)